MNMPQFSGEASCYKTGGHYHNTESFGHTGSAIYAAQMRLNCTVLTLITSGPFKGAMLCVRDTSRDRFEGAEAGAEV
jgi:hypothetical protein